MYTPHTHPYLPLPPPPPPHTHTQTLRDCLQKVTEKVSTGEQEGSDTNEETEIEGRREAQLARIQAMLDTTTVHSVLNTVISRKYGRWR